MAVTVRRPTGRSMRIAPSMDYSGVTSSFAQSLLNAKNDEENAQLTNMVLSFRRGDTNFADISSYIKNLLAIIGQNTSKSADLNSLLFNLEKENLANIRAIKRAGLESQYVKEGISAAERLEIERQMLGLERPGTPEYAAQESTVKQAEEASRVESNNLKIQTMINEASKGGLTAAESLSILREARKYTQPGTEEAINLEKSIAEAEESAEVEKLNNLRATLIRDKMKGGLTTEEQISTVDTLLGQATPDTAAYNSLVVERAELENTLISERETKGKTAKLSSLDSRIYDLKLRLSDIERNYQTGGYLGQGGQYSQDKMKTLTDLIGQYEQLRASGGFTEQDFDDLTQAKTNLVTSQINFKQRQAGNLFDVQLVDGTFAEYSPANPNVFNYDFVKTDIGTYVPRTRYTAKPIKNEHGNVVGEEIWATSYGVDQSGKITKQSFNTGMGAEDFAAQVGYTGDLESFKTNLQRGYDIINVRNKDGSTSMWFQRGNKWSSMDNPDIEFDSPKVLAGGSIEERGLVLAGLTSKGEEMTFGQEGFDLRKAMKEGLITGSPIGISTPPTKKPDYLNVAGLTKEDLGKAPAKELRMPEITALRNVPFGYALNTAPTIDIEKLMQSKLPSLEDIMRGNIPGVVGLKDQPITLPPSTRFTAGGSIAGASTRTQTPYGVVGGTTPTTSKGFFSPQRWNIPAQFGATGQILGQNVGAAWGGITSAAKKLWPF